MILTDKDSVTIIVLSFGQIEQAVHKIRIYSTRKAFLERTVVELVHKFDEKSTASVCKGKSTTKVPFKLFGGSHTYIHIQVTEKPFTSK